MKKNILCVLACAVWLTAGPAMATPDIGKPAPDFTATDIKGETVKLSDLKGKPVVLEWTNSECPFVKKHYGAGNMQKTQVEAAKNGAVWISIVSSGPGRQGFVTAAQAQKIIDDAKAHPAHKILDTDGAIGHLYDAKTTPDMFVIDKDGTLVYAGAIDDQPDPWPQSLAKAKNYVLAALNDLKAGRKVAVPLTEPYGCGVKYAR